MDFPLSPEGLVDPKVAAVIAVALTQWLKRYLPDWRYTQLVVLGLTLGLELAIWAISGEVGLIRALLAGFWGASIATFGYEVVANWLGIIGIGSRGGGRS